MSRLVGDKARNVAVLCWIEDLEHIGMGYGDLLAVLDGMHIECVVSPLHDRDSYTPEDVRKWCRAHIDPDTGDVAEDAVVRIPKVGAAKKAHVHIMLRFKGARTASYCEQLMADAFGHALPCFRAQKWEKVEHVESMMRYFAHLDQPDKAEYSAFDVVGLGGVDLSCLVKNDVNSKLKTLCDVQAFVQKKGIKSYAVLVRWAFNGKNLDYINCVTGRASYFAAYFNACRQDLADKAAAKKAKQSESVARVETSD